MNASRPAYRKWIARFLFALAVFVLLLPLFTGRPERIFTWVLLVGLFVYLGTGTWEDRRKLRADQSNSAAISSSDQT